MKISRVSPLIEFIQSSTGTIHKILIQKDKKNPKLNQIITLARKKSIPLHFVPKKNLDRWDKNHQGIVAFGAEKVLSSLEDVLSSSKLPFFVLLDNIEDPQNLGAIIRTAEGAGVDALIIPERRTAGLTESVFRVSAGALSYVKVSIVKNLVRTMEELKKHGIWIVGAEGEGEKNWYEFDYTIPLAIVLGSEGKGLRTLVKKKCDLILSIPLFGHINSLNVAAASSIFLFEVVRQRMNKKIE